ncbi:hypothetical protein HDU81_002998 [Chytriomyces hyalinus]|nr:hypothetical protein HDU81_002998 [Chytriomyces hyalinus]
MVDTLRHAKSLLGLRNLKVWLVVLGVLVVVQLFSTSVLEQKRAADSLPSAALNDSLPDLPSSSSKLDLASNPAQPRLPRILHYNRHSACHNNLEYVTSRLGLNFTYLRPGFLGGLGMHRDRANDIINDGLVSALCKGADVIIISDTLPDARPILQSLLRQKPSERCSSQVVVELTTRFDWGVGDFDEYHQLMWELSKVKPKNLHWVANNAFEAKVMADDALANPEFRILRPSGFSDVPKKPISADDKSLAMMRELDHSEVLATMTYLGIPFRRMVGHYGGPHTLKQFRAYVEFPYQVSTMKLYENLSAGVVMLIPSKDFFKELIDKKIHAFGPWEMLRRMGPNWHEYMDYYVPELSPYIYYFDSFDHLSQLLNSTETLDTKNVRENAPKAYETIREEMLHGWAELFAEMGFPDVKVDGKASTTAATQSVKKFTIPIRYTEPKDVNEWKLTYKQVKEWKHQQNVQFDQNKPKLNDLEREIKEAMSSGRGVQSLLRKKNGPKVDLMQVQVLDYLNGEKDGMTNVFGGSLKDTELDVASAVDTLLKQAQVEVNVDFELPDFFTFGHLARYLHIFHVLGQSTTTTLDASIKAKIPDFENRINSGVSTLSNKLYPWLVSSTSTWDSIDSLRKPWKGRGIALTFSSSGFRRGLHVILSIRHIHSCKLPIEIFHIGDQDLSLEKRTLLAQLPGVSVIDIQTHFPNVQDVKGFNIKPFVMLASSFAEVIFVDDDVTLIQSPETLVKESENYKVHGTLFFLDRSFGAGNSTWVQSILPYPSSMSETSRYMRGVSRDEQESAFVALDKGRLGVLHALLAACHMNLKESREQALHKHTHGDKESFWIGHELVRAPYAFVPGIGGAAGIFRAKPGQLEEKEVICGPQSHIDEKKQLSHFNGVVLLHKDEPEKGYIDFHHYVAPVLENTGNVDIGFHPWCVHSRKPDQEVFEIRKEDREVLKKTIELHQQLVKNEFDVLSDGTLA